MTLLGEIEVETASWPDIYKYRNGLRGYIAKVDGRTRLDSGGIVRMHLNRYSSRGPVAYQR